MCNLVYFVQFWFSMDDVVSQCSGVTNDTHMCYSPEPESVTLSGKKHFAGVIEWRLLRLRDCSGGPDVITKGILGESRGLAVRRGAVCVVMPWMMGCWRHQSEWGTTQSWTGPARWSCPETPSRARETDFGLLTSRDTWEKEFRVFLVPNFVVIGN